MREYTGVTILSNFFSHLQYIELKAVMKRDPC